MGPGNSGLGLSGGFGIDGNVGNGPPGRAIGNGRVIGSPGAGGLNPSIGLIPPINFCISPGSCGIGLSAPIPGANVGCGLPKPILS